MDATEYLLRRLDRVSIHLSAIGEMDMSTDVELGRSKIKELEAKNKSLDATIANLLEEIRTMAEKLEKQGK